MKQKLINKLAKKAGFIFWEDEEYAGDRAGKIDWSCDYDNELKKFAKLVKEEVMKEISAVARSKDEPYDY